MYYIRFAKQPPNNVPGISVVGEVIAFYCPEVTTPRANLISPFAYLPLFVGEKCKVKFRDGVDTSKLKEVGDEIQFGLMYAISQGKKPHEVMEGWEWRSRTFDRVQVVVPGGETEVFETILFINQESARAELKRRKPDVRPV